MFSTTTSFLEIVPRSYTYVNKFSLASMYQYLRDRRFTAKRFKPFIYFYCLPKTLFLIIKNMIARCFQAVGRLAEVRRRECRARMGRWIRPRWLSTTARDASKCYREISGEL